MRIGTRNAGIGVVGGAVLMLATSTCVVSFSEYYEGKGGAGGTGTSSNGAPGSNGAAQSTTGTSSPTATSTNASATGAAGGSGGAGGSGAETSSSSSGSGSSSTGTPLDLDWPNWKMPNGPYDVAQQGAPNLDTYLDIGDGTVTDTVTHLMWQKDVDAGSYTQPEAVNYCTFTLNTGAGLAGHTDWRLPTRIELVSLVDFSIGFDGTNPSINAAKFPDTPLDSFWTVTPVAGSPPSAWYVYFLSGHTGYYNTTSMYRVRCVR